MTKKVEMWGEMEVDDNDEKWEKLRASILQEKDTSKNPNFRDINVLDLNEEDLLMWEKFKNYKATGEGLRVEEFTHYTQDVMNRQNISSAELRAYMVDYLTELFYPKS